MHTYAPISVHFDDDEGSDIVSLLHAAYEPGKYESWPLRPEVDIISEAEDGRVLAPEGLVAAIRDGYAKIGVEAKENDTYHLHPMTMAYEFSVEFAGKVICVELGRATLAEEFTPFDEMVISEAKVRRMARGFGRAGQLNLLRKANQAWLMQRKSPWRTPQRRKVQPAPCHRPPRAMVMRRLA